MPLTQGTTLCSIAGASSQVPGDYIIMFTCLYNFNETLELCV